VQHEEEKRAHNSCSLQVPRAGAEMAGNGGCKLRSTGEGAALKVVGR